MGKLIKGLNGQFSGKVGDIVGSSWRGIHYVRSMPKASPKPKSEKQLAQQAKFGLAVKFLQPFKHLLNIGFGEFTLHSTGFNLAIKHTLEDGVTGEYPNYVINYPAIRFSRGHWCRPECVKLMAGAGCLVVIWNGNRYRPHSFCDDTVHIVVYEPETHTYINGPANVQRVQEASIISIPQQLQGKTLHTYLFCVSHTGKVSDTVYAGEIII